MRLFTDTAGRSWELRINVATIKRVRDLVKVDLPGLFDDGMQPLGDLLDDPCQLVDVLFCLADPTAKGVTDIEFGSALSGDVLQNAADMFLEELIDFFPKAKAANLRKLLGEIRQVLDKRQLLAAKELEGLNADALLARLTPLSGAAPGSVDWNPGASLSAN